MEVVLRRAPLLPALAVALIVACDGGAPVESTRPLQLSAIDTRRPGVSAHVRGSGLTTLRSLLLDGVKATELVEPNGAPQLTLSRTASSLARCALPRQLAAHRQPLVARILRSSPICAASRVRHRVARARVRPCGVPTRRGPSRRRPRPDWELAGGLFVLKDGKWVGSMRDGFTATTHVLDNIGGGIGRLPNEVTRKRMAELVD